MPLVFRSIDTMWESRNSSLPSDITQSQVNQHINALADINTTHITCAGFMDYPTSLSKWVTAIRNINKNVWFRLSWDHWQGTHGETADMIPSEYITATISFIQNNQSLFQNGDIFEFALEPAAATPHWNSTYGNDWASGSGEDAISGRSAYNSFIQSGIMAMTSVFSSIDKTGVICNLNSELTNVVIDVYTQETVNMMSALCIDFHPEGSNEDISHNVDLHTNEIAKIKLAWPYKNIVYSEISYCNDHEVSDELQKNTLQTYFNTIFNDSQIIGVNYWQSVGSNRSGVRLISGDKGAWNNPRPSLEIIKNFYASDFNSNGYYLIDLPEADESRLNSFKVLGLSVGKSRDIPHTRFSRDGTKVIVQGKIIQQLFDYVSGKSFATYLGNCLSNGRAEDSVYQFLIDNGDER